MLQPKLKVWVFEQLMNRFILSLILYKAIFDSRIVVDMLFKKRRSQNSYSEGLLLLPIWGSSRLFPQKIDTWQRLLTRADLLLLQMHDCKFEAVYLLMGCCMS